MKSPLAFALLGLLLQTPHPRGRISADELVATLYKQSGCNDPQLHRDAAHTILIEHLEYYDFRGDGNEEAIVVASTCWTGTAGPDVHAVYARNAAGKLVELPILDQGPKSPFNQKTPPPLVGNRNYSLAVEEGQLTARWSDTSDREEPLVIWYNWNGSAFVIDYVKQSGPFKTSYDCTKATQEVELAICYSKAVSVLDTELDELYRDQMGRSSVEERAKLREQQRTWLVQRNKCTIYKWWVECLSDLYSKRIAALRQQSN